MSGSIQFVLLLSIKLREKQSEIEPVTSRHLHPGDSGAERETRQSRQSPAGTHFVFAASQGL